MHHNANKAVSESWALFFFHILLTLFLQIEYQNYTFRDALCNILYDFF